MSKKLKYEIFEITPKPFGNSAHVILDKNYLGKRVKITIEVLNGENENGVIEKDKDHNK